MSKVKSIIAGVAALAATACSSSPSDGPVNPDEPRPAAPAATNVIYQANPRFFGTEKCLDGVRAQTPRIASMGCDILWLMPVCEPGELKAIGSPYCIRDFKALNPRYGTMDDLKSLVDDAHAKGMRVILDWIANHTAWDCPWIAEHPDWYRRDANGQIVAPNGWSDVAQLDYSAAGLRQAMKDAMLFWVDQAGIDGFRCDYAEGVPHDFWADVIADIRTKDANAFMLAESADPAFYADGFNMIYDWSCATAIASAFNGGKTSAVVTEASDAWAKVPDDGRDGDSILRFVFNHDTAAENNVATMYGAPEAVPAAYVLASMLCGTPMIYSSMDVEGLSGHLSFFDYRTLDFSQKLTDVYRAIDDAFKASADARCGTLADYSGASVVCFTRSANGRTLLVAVNTSGSKQSARMPISLAGETMSDLIGGGSTAVPHMLELDPYAYVILMK